MNLVFTYDEDFDNLMGRLRRELPLSLFEVDGIGSQLDLHQTSKQFFKHSGPQADLSVDANANVSGRDVITYAYEVPKPIMKMNSYFNLWSTLRDLYGKEVANDAITAQIKGDIYINDVWDIGRPYCFNYSTYDIALEGLKMSNRLTVERPKSLASFLRQVEQFTVYAANSTLGATGLADLLIVAGWYAKQIAATGYDGHIEVTSPYTYIYEQLTSLIYTLNWEFRGNQSPFTNVSVYDDFFLEELLPGYIINGEAPPLAQVKRVQTLFIQAYNDTLRRTPITFPVVTACFSVDDDKNIKDEEFCKFIAEHNMEFGAFNIYCGATSTLSSCCRLRSDINDIGYSNTFGAGSTKIGSLGVVTLNLPRLGYKAYADSMWFDFNLKRLVDLAAKINHAKRVFIQDRIKRGSLPLYTLGLMDLKKQFSTCGFTGLFEALELRGYDITEEDGAAEAERILDLINERNRFWAERTGFPHNMEQVPAETSSVKIATKDHLLGFNKQYPFYSNQFIPLTSKADILDRIRLQGRFDKHCTGGAICHLNIADKCEYVEAMELLIKICAHEGVVYWAVNYTLRKCEKEHITVGRSEVCHCGSPITDTYTRVVGFLTNTKHWNKTRRSEDWPNRVFYN